MFYSCAQADKPMLEQVIEAVDLMLAGWPAGLGELAAAGLACGRLRRIGN